jgi:hypothetical protein
MDAGYVKPKKAAPVSDLTVAATPVGFVYPVESTAEFDALLLAIDVADLARLGQIKI